MILIHLGKLQEWIPLYYFCLEITTAVRSAWCITTITQLWCWILVQDEMLLNRNGFQDICARLSGCKQCTLLGNALFHSKWCSLYILNTPANSKLQKQHGGCERKNSMVSVGPTWITKTEESRCKKKNTEVVLVLTEISRTQAMFLWMYNIYSNTEETQTPITPRVQTSVSACCCCYEHLGVKRISELKWNNFYLLTHEM